MTRDFDAIVIGAGVFGASCAWQLQQAGQRVLLLEQHAPAHARSSSGGDSRVLRLSYGEDALYTRMAGRALQLWRELLDAAGEPGLFQRTGVLWMARRDNVAAAASVRVLAGQGVHHEVLAGDELARRWPQIAVPDDGWAVFEPDSGVLLARRAVAALLRVALRHGLTYRCARVLPWMPEDAARGLVRVHGGDTFAAPIRIHAGGPWLGQLFPQLLARRIFVTRQEIHYFGPPPGDPRFGAGQVPTWMDFDRSWYGMPDLDGRGFKLADDSHGPPHDPDRSDRLPSGASIEAARAFLARRFPDLASAPLLGSEVCQYENTSNGDFLVDRHPDDPGTWLVGGGSGHGFKHGPALGEYVAAQVLGTAMAEPRFALAGKLEQQARAVH